MEECSKQSSINCSTTPTVLVIYPWLEIFPNSNLLLGFNYLIGAMNQFKPFYSFGWRGLSTTC
jgi:hypothetical protein